MGLQSTTPAIPAKAGGKRGAFKTFGIPAIAAFVGLALGTGAGSSGAQSELDEFRASEETMSRQIASFEAKSKESDASLRELSAEREASNKVLKERESEIQDLTAQKAALEQKARELEQQVTAANQLASEAQARAEAQAEPVPFAAPQQAGSGAAPAYFANCTAAREAGAAPVYAGDPGYGRHLDRDGDGVGCE